jgi:hypothetical protein
MVEKGTNENDRGKAREVAANLEGELIPHRGILAHRIGGGAIYKN